MRKRADDDTYEIVDMKGEEVVMSVTVLHPHKSTKGHKHANEEIYYFHQDAVIQVDTHEVWVKPGTFLIIKPNEFHRVVNDTDEDLSFGCCWRTHD